ncbi:PQQ-binding-like beta-propeller repeat protein [Streptomyces sp. NRRL S-87]|uniref:PQQ-binding-like beta-propeller repeat protein n=1 Tax=Streptomyces sp. NRRL S-87 TaxID=1463920 RepID=UPI0004C11E50|nr:PQQ-binding-like beta-propeller repeat protein [Streptomyces sp. NRRL S-87]
MATENRLNLMGDRMRGLPVAMHKTSAYVASSDRLQTVDLTSGRVRGTLHAQGVLLTSDDEGDTDAPLVVTDGGAGMVLAPFVLAERGTGTQSRTALLEVVSASAESGAKLWRMTVRLPDWAPTANSVTATAVGAGEGTAVVTVHGNTDQSVSYGIDLATHELRWTVPALWAQGVATGMVVGLLGTKDTSFMESVPAGFGLGTGKQKWQGSRKDYGLAMEAAGPSFVRLQSATGWSPGKLLRTDTGEPQALPAALTGLSCTYDEQATLVCGGPFAAAALDATSGRLLWQLKDGENGRNAPTITAVWHGRVYGKTGNGPVALDARTGKDSPTQPEAAPILVNEYGGLALTDGKLLSYPAGG